MTSRTSISPARIPLSRCAGASRPCASAARPSTTGRVRSSRVARSKPTAGPSEPRSWRSSIPRAVSAKRPSPRTSPRSCRSRRGHSVLLVDADTVTGHVSTSLGIDGVRTLADSWRDEQEGGPRETLAEIASAHSSGMRVASLTTSPLDTEILDPERVAEAITSARRGFDFIVVDLHPVVQPRSTRRSSRSPTGSSSRSRRTCRRSARPFS